MYPGGLRIFSNLNLVIRAASRYAIVGENVGTQHIPLTCYLPPALCDLSYCGVCVDCNRFQ